MVSSFHLFGSLPGIINKRLNCFASCILQTIFHTPSVVYHLSTYSCWCNNNRCLYSSLSSYLCLLKRCISNKCDVDASKLIADVLDKSDMEFGQMNDPNEFFSAMISGTKSCVEKDFLKKIFKCSQAELFKCNICDAERRFDFKSFLTIYGDDVVYSLKENSRDKEGDCKRTCAACQTKSFMSERSVITKPPQVLYLKPTDLELKLNFPLALDIAPFLLDKGRSQVMYHLYSIIVYRGSSKGYGHYFCYCKVDSRWYCYNDQQVFPVNVNLIPCSGEVTSLFYKKAG